MCVYVRHSRQCQRRFQGIFPSRFMTVIKMVTRLTLIPVMIKTVIKTVAHYKPLLWAYLLLLSRLQQSPANSGSTSHLLGHSRTPDNNPYFPYSYHACKSFSSSRHELHWPTPVLHVILLCFVTECFLLMWNSNFVYVV